MLILSLLRHAKSSWDDPSVDDFGRTLSRRGVKAAAAMGAHLAQEDLKPDAVLCSGAARARATLALLLPELGSPPPHVVHEDELYLATPRIILDHVRAIDHAAKSALVIGHNPGLHLLALDLVRDGGREELESLAMEFPTCALAVVSFPFADWAAVGPATGTLTRFMTPRRLP